MASDIQKKHPTMPESDPKGADSDTQGHDMDPSCSPKVPTCVDHDLQKLPLPPTSDPSGATGSQTAQTQDSKHQTVQTPDASPRTRRGAADSEEAEDDGYGTALGRLASSPTSATATTRTRSNSTLSSPLPPPPDGGLRAWTQVAAGWLVLFATWGYLNSFGSFQSYYTATALPTHSPSSISWIGSVQACLTTAIGAFTGRLLDAGYFRPTFAIGAALQLTGMFAMSAASDGDSPKYWHLMLTQGVLSGVGAGILFTPSMALVATWFGKRRGLAIGLATTGNSMGGIVYPVIVQQLIPRVGFAWTARALGFVNLACFGLALALMRTRLPPRRSGPVIDWSAFGEGVYVAYVAALFFFCWANYYTFYYIASFGIESLGLSYGDAAFLVVIVNGAGLPARILVPMLSDRIGPLNVMSMSMICIATVITCWLAVSDIPGLYAFTAVCGLVSGAVQSLMPTTVASITRRLDTVGTRLGMCFSILSVASLTGPPIGGALQSASGGSFTGAQAWAAVSALLGAAFVVLARGFRVGWKPREKC